MIEAARQSYPDRGTQARALAELVGDQLRAAHAAKSRATLAVPGGTTPGAFLTALSEIDLAWDEIDVILTDERLVPEGSSRSNARLVHDTLLRNRATLANLMHFQTAGTGPDARLAARLAKVLPIDVLVLGMGADGHTASLFPDAPDLAAALDPAAPPVVQIHPAGQPEARLTLTAPVIRAAMVIHVLITGEDKRAVLDAASVEGPEAEAPIRVALTAPCPVTVHYAP